MAKNRAEQVKELNKWFQVMVANTTETREQMREDYELYFSDREDTRSQFSKKQLEMIQESYDVPISTKIAWAIIEQMTAYMTGGKPSPRLIASTSTEQDFAIMYTQALTAAWYEGNMNRETAQWVRDGLVTGRGWLQIRPNDFYSESTFGVIAEHVDFGKVFVDPHAQKSDYSDAEMMCRVDIMPKSKAEKRYDITITEEDTQDFTPDTLWGLMADETNTTMGWPYASPRGNEKDRYVWIREFFSKQQANVYVSETGDVSTRKPRPIEIPNPEKAELGQAIAELRLQAEQVQQSAQAANQQVEEAQDMAQNPEVGLSDSIQASAGSQRAWDQASSQMDEMTAQLSEMEQQFASMPDNVTAYTMKTIADEEIQIRSFFRKSEKLIKRWLLIGDRIVEESLIPCDEYPLIPFTISQQARPDKVYGIMHYIKDLSHALNKFWSLMIYDMQTNSHRRVMYPAGSIPDPSQTEKDWAEPNKWLEYTPNNELTNDGRPEIMEGMPLNPAYERIIGMLQTMLEYIVGITGIQQATQPGAGPDSYGGIQASQAMGTQRIKLYSRSLESSMERMAYVYVSFLQAYAPKDKVIRYLDDNNDEQELKILENNEDIRFKVRIDMSASLPTARAMAAQMLGILGGQTADPNVQQLLTQYMVDMMDMPESAKMKEELNAVRNLSQQLEQMQKQVEAMQAQNAQLQQQMAAKDTQLEADKAKERIQAEEKIATAEVKNDNSPEQAAPTDGIEEPEEVPPF